MWSPLSISGTGRNNMLTIDENNNIAASAGVPASTDNLEVRA
jgi:hypothetical protein